MGIEPYTRYSPLLEKCCFLLSANESYQNVEKDFIVLTGMKISHSTSQRKVVKRQWELPDAKQRVSEISVDGGSIRLRSKIKGEKSF